MQPPLESASLADPMLHGDPWSSGPQVSDSAGPKKLYGALLDQRLLEKARAAGDLQNRRRLNILPILLSLLVPWCVFVGAFSLAAFYIHYSHPILTKVLEFIALVLCIVFIADARQARVKGNDGGFYRSYFAIAVTVAMFGGFLAGDYTFWTYSAYAYELGHMATYTNVDPSSELLWSGELQPTRGRQFQDAGIIYFKSNVKLDINKSSSFKMGKLYCVAPIVNPACGKDCGHDFWAVGVDCCSEDSAHFQCDMNNTHAKSGLRVMDEAARPFYRLAVLQAEGAHALHSPHPVFLYWLQDPIAEVTKWEKKSYKRFVLAMIFVFLLNAAILHVYLRGVSMYGRK